MLPWCVVGHTVAIIKHMPERAVEIYVKEVKELSIEKINPV